MASISLIFLWHLTSAGEVITYECFKGWHSISFVFMAFLCNVEVFELVLPAGMSCKLKVKIIFHVVVTSIDFCTCPKGYDL